MKRIIPKNRLFIPLMAVTIYAGITTPLAYESARKHVVVWAIEQPEADEALLKTQHETIEERLDNSMPGLRK